MDNEDLLTEILLRLPAKSLTRFKCVCKKWRTLISSDYFCHRHTLRRPKLQSSLILQIHTWYNYPQRFYVDPTLIGQNVMIPYSLNPPGYQILRACNGLLLLEYEYCNYPDKGYKRRDCFSGYYIVYNPTTGKSREILATMRSRQNALNSGFVEGDVSLAFDPSKSPYYKIVCLMSTERPDSDPSCFKYEIEIYESESHSWRLVRLEAEFIYLRIMCGGVYWNNAVYWMSQEDDSFCYFDIGKNVMKTLSFPEELVPDKFLASYLQELNGHLYVFQEEPNPNSIAVWELGMGEDDDHPEWLLKHHPVFNIDQMEGHPWFLRLSNRDGDGTCSLLSFRAPDDGNKMRAYNFTEKTWDDVANFSTLPFSTGDCFLVECFQFGETLALV